MEQKDIKIAPKFAPKVKIQNQLFGGALWCIGWLFTIGFIGLPFWKGVLAIIIWPYYLGDFIKTLL